jgi:hypothetical protein
MPPSEPTAQKFRSFAEAEAADDAYYASLTPQERMRILFGLLAAMQPDETQLDERLPRIRRVVERAPVKDVLLYVLLCVVTLLFSRAAHARFMSSPPPSFTLCPVIQPSSCTLASSNAEFLSYRLPCGDDYRDWPTSYFQLTPIAFDGRLRLQIKEVTCHAQPNHGHLLEFEDM